MKKNLKFVCLIVSLVCVQFWTGCESSGTDPVGSDADSDTDTDTDSDSDNDSDNDIDTDSDSDSDTDSDTDPDTEDDDWDDDGLSNELEDYIGTDPNNEDTDGDGVTDLVEWVAGTDPNDPNSNPAADGNFYFLMPYTETPDPTEDTLNFATDIKMADLFFLMDTTYSMYDEMTNLKDSLSSFIIPEVSNIISDIQFGVGHFDDYPNGIYGSNDPSPYIEIDEPDIVFELFQAITADTTAAQAAVDSLDLHNGVDWPESDIPALYATATGEGFGAWLDPQTSCASDEIGYPCFRDGAVPMVMLFTDAPFHNGPANANAYSGVTPTPPTYDDTVAALNDIHAKVITIRSGTDTEALSHCTSLSTDTGTVDDSDTPLVFSVAADGTGLDQSVVDAVQTVASSVPMDISTNSLDDTTDAVDATIFIDYITPYNVTTAECTGGLTTDDLDGDDIDDIFLGVNPGWPVCFDVIPKMNTTIEQTPVPQLFKAYIDVIGDNVTVLDTRTIFFLVPPSEPQPPPI